MIGRRAALGLLGTVASACARLDGLALPELKGGAGLGIKSSGRWTFFTMKPPHIIGPSHVLRLNGGFLRGAIKNTAIEVRIDKDSASGMTGPRPVEMDIHDEGHRLEVNGTWDGATVRLASHDGLLDATVPVLREDPSVSTVFRPSGSRPYCDFSLRERDPQLLVGRTSCGFNSQVQLEIAPEVQRWLSRSELAVILVALMSTADHG